MAAVWELGGFGRSPLARPALVAHRGGLCSFSQRCSREAESLPQGNPGLFLLHLIFFLLFPAGSSEYYVNDAPRVVLDKLERCGYRVVSMTGVGQTLVWCLHKQ